MIIKNPLVSHPKFGLGTITFIDSSYVYVKFSDGSRQFNFPDAFDNFLSSDDEDLNIYISDELAKKKKRKEEIESKKATSISIEKQLRKQKIATENIGNVAFKLNFCDGGSSDEQIGFNGICSDNLIEYNIKTAKHVWCSTETCPCYEYHVDNISREELDEWIEDPCYTCYESQLFRDWKALAGYYHNGERSGKPISIKNAKQNKLCVLTTREPGTPEKKRLIIGVFLIEDINEGGNSEEGYVSISDDSEYKIKLSADEAHKIPFWNYHANDSQPSTPFWGSGLFRYISDYESAQILRDISSIKKGKRDADLADRFFKHYCSQNDLDFNAIPEPNGALRRG